MHAQAPLKNKKAKRKTAKGETDGCHCVIKTQNGNGIDFLRLVREGEERYTVLFCFFAKMANVPMSCAYDAVR